MSKIADIQRQLEQASGRSRPAAIVPPAAKAAAPMAALTTAPAPSIKAPSREGKTHIGAYLPTDFKKSLRLVQAQTGEDVQSLIAKALNDLFRAHNVPVVGQD